MIISYTEKDKELLARIMRAEALNEGDLGMLMVGDVVINRAIANCYTFSNVNNIYDVIYQKNQFVGIDSIGNIHYFNSDFTYSIINYEREKI